MNENGKISFIYSWPVIILALLIFWPIGLLLIIRRVTIDRKTAMVAGKTISLLGIASYAFAVLFILAGLSEGLDSGFVICILFFGIAGFVLRRLGGKLQKESENIKKYLSMIINGNERELDVIASSMGKGYDNVKSDLQKMINKGYFKNAYIDEGRRVIVLQDRIAQEQTTTKKTNANVPTKIVACPCCGANNTIVGDTGECEYCGTPLK